MLADQVIMLALLAVLCSIVCGLATLLVPSRWTPTAARTLPPVQRAQARHASHRPVDTPTDGVRGPLRSAGPQRAPDTRYIDGPVGRPYVPPIVIQGPTSARGLLPYDGPVVRIPQCSLCHDGVHVIGAVCIICGALPVLPEVRA